MEKIQAEFLGYSKEWEGVVAPEGQVFAIVRVRHHEDFYTTRCPVSELLSLDVFAQDVVAQMFCESAKAAMIEHEQDLENRILLGTGGVPVGFLSQGDGRD